MAGEGGTFIQSAEYSQLCADHSILRERDMARMGQRKASIGEGLHLGSPRLEGL